MMENTCSAYEICGEEIRENNPFLAFAAQDLASDDYSAQCDYCALFAGIKRIRSGICGDKISPRSRDFGYQRPPNA